MKPRQKDFIFVGIQFVLFAVYAMIPHTLIAIELPTVIGQAGGIIAVVGLFLMVGALTQLNQHLSPFPTPKFNTELKRNGAFRFCRHPIYTGIFMAAFGASFFSGSVIHLLLAFALLILFFFKSAYEESLLIQKFPAYLEYQKRTRRFFPMLSGFKQN